MTSRSNTFAFDLAFQRDEEDAGVDRGSQRLCLNIEADFQLESKGIPGRRLRHLAESCGLEIEGLEDASILLLRYECAIRSLPFAVLTDRQELSSCLLAVALWDVLSPSDLQRELRHWGRLHDGSGYHGQGVASQLVDALWTALAEAKGVPVRRFAAHVASALVGKAARLEMCCPDLVEGEYRRSMRRLGLPADDGEKQFHIQSIMLALVLEEASMTQLKEECRHLDLRVEASESCLYLQRRLFVETLCKQNWEAEGLPVSQIGHESCSSHDVCESCFDAWAGGTGVMPNKLAKQTLSTNPTDHSFKLYKDQTFKPVVKPAGRASTKSAPKLKPNDNCDCGSGKKYKKCCMNK